MSVSDSKIDEAINLFQKHGGVLRTAEAEEAGIHNRTLYHILEEGYVEKLERGLYKLADKEVALSNLGLIIVTKKVPAAKICLLSALDFHEMTTNIPHEVHIAIPKNKREPRLDHPPIRTYRFSGQSLSEGVERHEVDGIEISVYNPAKTIADCFKFRNKIGLDIAIEAIKNGIRENKTTYREILKYAKICRVQKVIKPYLEAIAHS